MAGLLQVWSHGAGVSRTVLLVGVAACVVGAGLTVTRRDQSQRQRVGVAAARAIASAVETYQLEYGAFPRATDRSQLESALAPLLPRPDPLAHTSGRFRYRATASTYTLDFTPAGGTKVVLRVRRGRGGTAVAAGRKVSIAW